MRIFKNCFVEFSRVRVRPSKSKNTVRKEDNDDYNSSSTDSADENSSLVDGESSNRRPGKLSADKKSREGQSLVSYSVSGKSATVCLERLVIPSTPSSAEQSNAAGESPSNIEHNYFAQPQSTKRSRQDSLRDSTRISLSESALVDNTQTEQLERGSAFLHSVELDHCYCRLHSAENELDQELERQTPTVASPVKTTDDKSQKASRSHKMKRGGGLSDVTNVSISRELSSILTPVVPPPRPRFERRDYGAELVTLFKFLITGADAEDISFLRRRYEELLQLDSAETDWLNEIHWVDHPVTCLDDPSLAPPPRKRRKHGPSEDDVSQHKTG